MTGSARGINCPVQMQFGSGGRCSDQRSFGSMRSLRYATKPASVCSP